MRIETEDLRSAVDADCHRRPPNRLHNSAIARSGPLRQFLHRRRVVKDHDRAMLVVAVEIMRLPDQTDPDTSRLCGTAGADGFGCGMGAGASLTCFPL